jgi:hypothetical protein
MRHRSALLMSAIIAVIVLSVVGVVKATDPPADGGVIRRLTRIERLLRALSDAIGPERVAAEQRTRLLLPFVTNQAGFDTGVVVSNTGRDSTGDVGQAGNCTIHYFGSITGGGPAPAPQTTNSPVGPGEQLTFVMSSGGGRGIAGTPGFQGYLEITCEFPFAHGFGFMTDGPIGAARIGSTIPALVLPTLRSSAFMESAGQ